MARLKCMSSETQVFLQSSNLHKNVQVRKIEVVTNVMFLVFVKTYDKIKIVIYIIRNSSVLQSSYLH